MKIMKAIRGAVERLLREEWISGVAAGVMAGFAAQVRGF